MILRHVDGNVYISTCHHQPDWNCRRLCGLVWLLNADKFDGSTSLLTTTVLTSVTGFLFPTTTILPSEIVGVVSLVALGIAIFALYRSHLAGAWRWVYVTSALFALYLNVFVGVVQSFQKLAFLKPLAPTQSEAPFLIAQLVVIGLFVVLGILAVKKFHPEIVVSGALLRHRGYRWRAIARGQERMQRRHHLRALADRRRDALDRAGAHVADRKDAPRLVSSGRRPHASRAGQHEPLGIQRHAGSGQPIGVRIRADEQEQVANRPPHFLARRARRQRIASSMPSSPSRPVTLGPASPPRHWAGPRCGRPDSATCSPRGPRPRTRSQTLATWLAR